MGHEAMVMNPIQHNLCYCKANHVNVVTACHVAQQCAKNASPRSARRLQQLLRTPHMRTIGTGS